MVRSVTLRLAVLSLQRLKTHSLVTRQLLPRRRSDRYACLERSRGNRAIRPHCCGRLDPLADRRRKPRNPCSGGARQRQTDADIRGIQRHLLSGRIVTATDPCGRRRFYRNDRSWGETGRRAPLSPAWLPAQTDSLEPATMRACVAHACAISPKITSEIATIIIHGAANGTARAGDSFGFVAEEIGAAEIDGQRFAFAVGATGFGRGSYFVGAMGPGPTGGST